MNGSADHCKISNWKCENVLISILSEHEINFQHICANEMYLAKKRKLSARPAADGLRTECSVLHFPESCSVFHRHKSIHKYCGRQPFICSVIEIAKQRSLFVVRGVQSKWCWCTAMEFMQHSNRSGMTNWLKCPIALQLNHSPISVMNHFVRITAVCSCVCAPSAHPKINT